MAHRSRLSQALAGQQLGKAATVKDQLACAICGCTENNACRLTGGQPCSWVVEPQRGIRGLCSNPACLKAANVEIVEDNGVEEEELTPEEIADLDLSI